MTPNLFRHEGPERSEAARDWKHARLEAMSLADYKANWDGEGAIPVPQKLIAAAISFFKYLEKRHDPAPDSVYPLASGAVMAEWHYADGTTASAEIRQPGKAEVLVWHSKRPSVYEVVTWENAPPRCGVNVQEINSQAWESVAHWLEKHKPQGEPRPDSATLPPEALTQRESIFEGWMLLVHAHREHLQVTLRSTAGDDRSADGERFSLAA